MKTIYNCSVIILIILIISFLDHFFPDLARADVLINEVLAANSSINLTPDHAGFNDWLELYNSGTSAYDLTDHFLSDDLAEPYKWQIDKGTVIGAGGFLLFFADSEDEDHHTNFKLDKKGGVVALFDPDGNLVNSVAYGEQKTDVSYGRKPDGAAALYYFDEPTPAASNSTTESSLADRADRPQFSLSSGFYENAQTLVLTSTLPGAVIRYTLDGSKPNSGSTLYSGGINLQTTKVVRARAYPNDGSLPSKTETHSYFINDPCTITVISLATNNDYIYDDDIGIYPNYDEDWERPVSMEVFGTDGALEYQVDAGVGIYGGYTRQLDQKSLTIHSRDKYGPEVMEYQFFPGNSTDKYRSIILRNSGNDWVSTMFRDALAQGLFSGQVDLDTQAYRPAVVYINGQYVGIQNIRERMDVHYIENHFGMDSDKIDFVEKEDEVIRMDDDHYQNLIDYLETNDMSQTANYEYIKTLMDVENYLNYFVGRVYYADQDWPNNNLKFWRPHTDTGRWRWLVFDQDFSFSLYSERDYTWNSLEFSTDPDGPDGDDPWSTVIIGSLLDNQDFSNDFIQRFCSFINIIFDPARVKSQILDKKTVIANETPRHYAKWFGFTLAEAAEEWGNRIEVLNEFADNRPEYMRQHLKEYFGLEDLTDLTVSITGADGGVVYVNGVPSPAEGFTGRYFKSIPIKLKAVPRNGFAFTGWTGPASGTDPETTVTLTGAGAVSASFAADQADYLVINEIHYNPSSGQGSDDDYEFMELYNAGKNNIDLSGWAFTDGIIFTFPDGSGISPGEYLVVAKKAETYSGKGYQVFEWASGKSLSNDGETIRLENSLGEEMDQLTYNDKAPWPLAADGRGPSLELINPLLANEAGSNWKSSRYRGGTPGRANSKGQYVPGRGYLNLLLD